MSSSVGGRYCGSLHLHREIIAQNIHPTSSFISNVVPASDFTSFAAIIPDAAAHSFIYHSASTAAFLLRAGSLTINTPSVILISQFETKQVGRAEPLLRRHGVVVTRARDFHYLNIIANSSIDDHVSTA